MSFTPATTPVAGFWDLNRWSRQIIGLSALLAIAGVGLMVIGAKLPALACLAAAAGGVILVKPDTATLAMTMILYTNAAGVATHFHGVPRMAAAGVFLLLVVPFYHQVVVQRKEIVIAPGAIFLTLFAIVQLIGMLLALKSDVATGALITTVSEGLVFYLLVTNVIRDKTMLRCVLLTLLIAGSCMGALTIAQRIGGDFNNTFGGFAQVPVDEFAPQPAVFDEPPRAGGPVGEENYYGQFMLMLLPLALTFALIDSRQEVRWGAVVAAAIIALAIAFTASRAAAVTGVVMVVAMVAWRLLKPRHVLVLALAATVIVLASPQLRLRMASMAQLANFARGNSEVRQVDKSTQGRISEIAAAVLIFADHPITGVGPGNFPSQFLKKADAMGFQIHAEERMAHCAILEIAAENGVFGLACIIGIFVVTFRGLSWARRITTDDELRSLATAMLVVLIVMMFSSLFLSFAYVRYYWFILALAAVTARVAASASVQESSSPAPES